MFIFWMTILFIIILVFLSISLRKNYFYLQRIHLLKVNYDVARHAVLANDSLDTYDYAQPYV